MSKLFPHLLKFIVLNTILFSLLIPKHSNATPEVGCIDNDGDGWGWDGEKSCRIPSDPPLKKKDDFSPEPPVFNKKLCRNWEEIQFGNYRMMNNTWGRHDVNMGGWSQCIELVKLESQILAKWHYNWLGREDGNEVSVKAYPQVYYGRKAGKHQSGPLAKLGLPRIIEKLENFKIAYQYSETGTAERNVAFESFFHKNCAVENSNKTYEMMVWVAKPSIRTPGKRVGEATIDGASWDIYTNPILPHPYIAFVRKSESKAGILDWNKFIDWIQNEGQKMSVTKIAPKSCMGAIEFGTEIFWGEGTFTVEQFEVSKS